MINAHPAQAALPTLEERIQALEKRVAELERAARPPHAMDVTHLRLGPVRDWAPVTFPMVVVK